jgi:hypothetical protein
MTQFHKKKKEVVYPAIRATSHSFAHTKSATMWLQWLLRNSSIYSVIFTSSYPNIP